MRLYAEATMLVDLQGLVEAYAYDKWYHYL